MRNVAEFIRKHKLEIEEIQQALAVNFDAPAQRIINAGFARMREDRFDGHGDDMWEMVTCYLNGWEYEKPPAKLVNRWASY